MAARLSPCGVPQALVGAVSVSHLGNRLWRLYEFAQAAITMCHSLGGLNNGNLFSHSSEGQKFKITVQRAGFF